MPVVERARDFDADGAKAESTDELTSAFGLNNVKIAGSLDYGQTSTSTAYTSSPRYRAFKFSGNAGDDVEVWVKSANGDPVTWLLDNNWKTIAKNDDTSSSDTNSHIKVKLPASASATHYVVVRDYYQDPMSFTVQLAGGPADLTAGCNVDADCKLVDKACCSNYGETAVLSSNAAAYKASLNCAAHTICPQFVKAPDYAVAECNVGTHKCEIVKPADIKCGSYGIIAPTNPHACPGGYSCKQQGDAPGTCTQFCGGIAGIACHAIGDVCVDDPSDSCDPAHGGADCGGICQHAVEHCGGIANIQCTTPGTTCVDDPSDSCDPAHGGADCGGICQ